MAHYVDNGDNTEESMSSDEESNDENEYFHPKPRRINFDDLEFGNGISESDTTEEIVPKQKRKKLVGEERDEPSRKFICDICKKFFDKRWALNSHMLSHSGFVETVFL